jgi:hypothetical protein
MMMIAARSRETREDFRRGLARARDLYRSSGTRVFEPILVLSCGARQLFSTLQSSLRRPSCVQG